MYYKQLVFPQLSAEALSDGRVELAPHHALSAAEWDPGRWNGTVTDSLKLCPGYLPLGLLTCLFGVWY